MANDNYVNLKFSPDSRPSKLYKYYGNIEYAITALESKSIYMDFPSSFNDPFDELYSPYHIGSTMYLRLDTYFEIICYFLSNKEYIENYWGEIDFAEIWHALKTENECNFIELKDAIEHFIDISRFNKIPQETIFTEIMKTRKKLYKGMKNDIFEIGCFCESYKSIPMWSYYGKNYTGLCLEYDLTLLSNDNIKNHIYPVLYSRKRPREDAELEK
ncbi:MAG: DUF2971 domain-containing protein [Oscillospiraceae bacterium]|jgi:hypothetical protein|nr:DUF2971 domain-containing protein [Oscillospiraceae bacterium]